MTDHQSFCHFSCQVKLTRRFRLQNKSRQFKLTQWCIITSGWGGYINTERWPKPEKPKSTGISFLMTVNRKNVSDESTDSLTHSLVTSRATFCFNSSYYLGRGGGVTRPGNSIRGPSAPQMSSKAPWTTPTSSVARREGRVCPVPPQSSRPVVGTWTRLSLSWSDLFPCNLSYLNAPLASRTLQFSIIFPSHLIFVKATGHTSDLSYTSHTIPYLLSHKNWFGQTW